MIDEILFPAKWINSGFFDQALTPNPLQSPSAMVRLGFPVNCKIMVDAGARVLSLANQLHYIGKRVLLTFEEGETGAMGYLNRMGFFDLLHPEIKVEPERPYISGAEVYRGSNQKLVEFAAINPGKPDRELPSRLEQSVSLAVYHRIDHDKLAHTAYTLFAELVDNIFEHSSTLLDGIAVLQVYSGGDRIIVAVSDSGHGILATLRPYLQEIQHPLSHKSDTDLVIEAFRTGLSRLGQDNRGCGLKRCADLAVRFNTVLEIRLPTCAVRLKPSQDGFSPHTAYTRSDLPLLWGTHISFHFTLDSQS